MTEPARHELITGQDACSILGISPSTLRGWVHRGLLPRYGSARASLYAWPDLARAADAAKPRKRIAS